MQRDIITSTITWHLGLIGSNNFGEYTSFSPFTLSELPSMASGILFGLQNCLRLRRCVLALVGGRPSGRIQMQRALIHIN